MTTSKSATTYEFKNFGLKFVDTNQNGVLDLKDQVKIGKKTVAVSSAFKNENPELAKFQKSLVGDGSVSLNGLKFVTAKNFLAKKAEAKNLQEEISEVPGKEVVATYEKAQATYREAKLLSIQLFEDVKKIGPVKEHQAEEAAGATLKFLPGLMYKSAAQRIKQDGDLEGAKEIGMGEAEMKEVFQGRAEKHLKDIQKTATENPKAAKKEFRVALKDLRKSEAPRSVMKDFKKEYRGLEPQKAVVEIVVPTPADPDVLNFSSVLDSIPRKKAYDHSAKAAKACSDIKVLYGPKGKAVASQKAAQLSLTEYGAIYKDFTAVKKRVDDLNAKFAKLPKDEKAKYKNQLLEVNNAFAWYRQDVDAAYLSAKVSALDHNFYFPASKLTVPQQLH